MCERASVNLPLPLPARRQRPRSLSPGLLSAHCSPTARRSTAKPSCYNGSAGDLHARQWARNESAAPSPSPGFSLSFPNSPAAIRGTSRDSQMAAGPDGASWTSCAVGPLGTPTACTSGSSMQSFMHARAHSFTGGLPRQTTLGWRTSIRTRARPQMP
ncbi:hypothetical protein BS50DRAFT_366361 [Corynespora cassiicola Philippines]|uniref:Uncharacterized protein n=1 Tax=Corynespora cassiicola Philippines TaxID=1448308 RepID=A0A2T2NSV9_CORCC|nr:hypothetical protein BS50DRAFT_366361 [Corynespora cassiicola Philippines]